MSLTFRNKRSPTQSAVTRWLCCMMPAVTSPTNPPITTPQADFHLLLNALDDLKDKSESRDSVDNLDIEHLCRVLHDPGIQATMQIHDILDGSGSKIPEGTDTALMNSIVSVCDDIKHRTYSNDIQELYKILTGPHIRGLAVAHDDLLNRSYETDVLPEVPHEVDEDEESIKMVRIIKGEHEPLGATIRLNDETGAIEIARVMLGGAADRSGLICVGDEVCTINGVCVSGKQPDQIVKILAEAVGPITLTMIPGYADTGIYEDTKLCVRAHFSYDPSTDPMCPCREAGLAFSKGDILQIVNQDDPMWWQAKKLRGDANMRAGLIPARTLQERKTVTNTNNKTDTTIASLNTTKTSKLPTRTTGIPKPSNNAKNRRKDSNKTSGKSSPKLNKKQKKTKRIMYQAQQNDDYDTDEVVTYEEVELVYPHPQYTDHPHYPHTTLITHPAGPPCSPLTHDDAPPSPTTPAPPPPRPVVLVGPTGVATTRIQQRLVHSDPDTFQMPALYTNAHDQPTTDSNTHQLIYTKPEQLHDDIQARRFLDVQEAGGHLLCLSQDSVKSVMNKNKVCVLTCQPQSLKHIRVPELKPFVVFVKPPSLLEQLRMSYASSRVDNEDNREMGGREGEELTETDLEAILTRTARIEEVYSHYFDFTLINDDLVRATNELCAACETLKTEPQWVPATWVR